MDFIILPYKPAEAVTGMSRSQLQQEFTDLLSKYAAAQMRAKEGGQEAERGQQRFSGVSDEVKALSLFQIVWIRSCFRRPMAAKSPVNSKDHRVE